MFGLAQWADSWVLVQVEEDKTGTLAVTLCEITAVEGDGAARLHAILRQKGVEKSTGVGVLTPGQYRTFLEETVNAPAEELGSIMRWRVRDRMDFPVENAVVAVQPVPNRKRDDAAEKSMVNVFIANQDEVMRLSALSARLQINLVAVDAHESALRHVAACLEENATGGTILLHIGPQDTHVMAIRDTENLFSRRIKVGTERINDHLRGTTETPKKALSTALEPLALELQRTLEYIRTRLQLTVEKIRLAPLEHPIAGLTEALGTFLPSVAVIPLDVTGIINFVDGVPEERNLALALPALGAALGHLRGTGSQVNLLEARLRPKQEWLSGKPILGLGALSLLTLGALLGTLHWHMGHTRAEFAAISSQEAILKAEVLQLVNNSTDQALDIRLENLMQKLTEKISMNKRLLEFLQGNKLGQLEGFSGHMEELSRHAVPGIWLTAMTFRDGGQEMGFVGKGSSVDLVPRFVESLGRAAHFRDKRFDVLRIWQVDATKEGPIGFTLRTKRIPEMHHE
ncbi:MAG: PilN domain-containing protein [Magnetococcales bacterium]|nr:PilN domain-containing protein [Magnetococcales bacterium]